MVTREESRYMKRVRSRRGRFRRQAPSSEAREERRFPSALELAKLVEETAPRKQREKV
jgi:hypothetical protein